MASPLFREKRGEVSRLLNEIDRLRDCLHDQFASISEADYRLFARELKIVIATLKALRQESQMRPALKIYDDRMRQQIADLEELDHDIYEFRVKAPKNELLQQSLSNVRNVDFSYLFQ